MGCIINIANLLQLDFFANQVASRQYQILHTVAGSKMNTKKLVGFLALGGVLLSACQFTQTQPVTAQPVTIEVPHTIQATQTVTLEAPTAIQQIIPETQQLSVPERIIAIKPGIPDRKSVV